MSLHGNSAKQRALSKKRVDAKLCELSSSRNLRKFLLMSEILSLNSKDKSAEYFKDEQITFKIIDGILHHMYPLPVRALDNTKMELNNQQKFDKLSDKYKKMIEISTKIGKVGSLSFRKSIYLEGRILSKADKAIWVHLVLVASVSL